MTNKKISELTELVTPSSTDIVPIVSAGETKKITVGNLIGDKYVRTTRFAIISSGTSGSVTLPSNSEVVLDDFGGTVDAVVSQVSGGLPTLISAKSSSGTVIATSFDSSGNWAFTGTPSAYPVAILYRVRQKLLDFDSTASNIWGNSNVEQITKADIGLGNVDNTSDINKPVSTATQTAINNVVDSDFRIQDNTTPTKKIAFEASAITAGQTRTLTAPDASGRILVEGQPIGNVTRSTGAFTTLNANSTTTLAQGNAGSSSTPLLSFGQSNTGFYHNGGEPIFTRNSVDIFKVGSTSRLDVVSSAGLQLSANDAPIRLSHGVTLTPQASGQLHQYEGSQAQQYYLYRDRTDSTNFERAFFKWDGTSFKIGTDKAGFGRNYQKVIFNTQGADKLEIDNSVKIVNSSGGKTELQSAVAGTLEKTAIFPQMSGTIQLERNEDVGNNFYECQSYSKWLNGPANGFLGTDKWTVLPNNSLNWIQLRLIYAKANGKTIPEGFDPINQLVYVDYTMGSLYYVDYGWGLAPGNYADFMNGILSNLTMSTQIYPRDDLFWIASVNQLDDFVLIFEETGYIDDGAGNNLLSSPLYFSVRNQETTLIDSYSVDLGSVGNIISTIEWKQWTRL